ncbi:hypothetical protein QJS83_16230 [Bdellovibrio sp. 22V]|uniref:hypothetical protein n=1 Tax=Bdellovibrio TaxID=958 RepID=UPI00254277A4|nr:hypothetical protein [Bdellovibrio sp. 22V]WII72011.1 hypothetical protein QJS83_16230 [Bdellovibrio sp. 22V]
MSTHKIVEFRAQGEGPLIQYFRWLAKQKGWDWTLETHPEFAFDLMDGASAVKVASALSERILPQLKVLPTQVRLIQCLDSFFKEDGTWYPRILLYEAMRTVLVSEARDLDIRAPAFIVGDNEEARAAAFVVAQMGCSEIFLVGETARLQRQQEILSHSQIGIRFTILPPEELTMQAVSAGLIVNSVDLSKQKSLLTDLSYFNFMKRSGYALDLNLLPAQNLLLEEAEKAELKVLHPVSIATAITQLWMKRLQVNDFQSLEEIRESWIHFLKENSPSV